MFNKSNKTKKEASIVTNLPIDTVIADSVLLKGDIRGEGAIRIDGQVEGSIELNQGVILGEKAVVTGTIKSTEVVIYGKLIGDITCKELHIKSTGNIEGNIFVNSFTVELGGVYNGTLKMKGEEPKVKELGFSEKPPQISLAVEG
ncbi:MAG: polymer-forming cytoskeletal protein [Niabella sp.]